MIREKLKSKKGITLVALIITVIVLVILTSTIIRSVNVSNKVTEYNNMIADIKLLEDQILIYFNKYGELPITSVEKQIYDETYYEIDLSKLKNITLNYGNKYEGDETDVYLVNDNLTVYYLKGIESEGEIYHVK